MIEILVAVALIWLLVKAIGWLLAFIVALLSKFFAISINVIKIFFLGLIGIALGIGVIIGIINYIKAFVSRINPYEYYVDYSRKKQQYAKRKSYFFGPGFAQLRETFLVAWETNIEKVPEIWRWWDTSIENINNEILSLVIFLIACVFKICCIISVVVTGAVITIICAVIHAVILLFFAAIIYAVFGITWLIDRLYLKTHSIRALCPNCQERIVIPVFECSNPDCRAKHTRLVPSAYGIWHRKCVCGEILPTTFLLGRSRLRAYCPKCGAELAASDRKQFYISMVGGSSSGKTVLMTAFLYEFIKELHNNSEITLEIPEINWNDFKNVGKWFTGVADIEGTEKNSTSRMYSLLINSRNRKIREQFSIFDIAGEAFNDSTLGKYVNEQQLAQSNGIIIVVDPLAALEMREVAQREGDSIVGATEIDPSQVITNFVAYLSHLPGIPKIGNKISRPTAIIITKTDLKGVSTRISRIKIKSEMRKNPGRFRNYIEAQDTLCEEFLQNNGLAATYAAIKANFSNAHYFPLSAMGKIHKGEQFDPDEYILNPFEWLMRQSEPKFADMIQVEKEEVLLNYTNKGISEYSGSVDFSKYFWKAQTHRVKKKKKNFLLRLLMVLLLIALLLFGVLVRMLRMKQDTSENDNGVISEVQTSVEVYDKEKTFETKFLTDKKAIYDLPVIAGSAQDGSSGLVLIKNEADNEPALAGSVSETDNWTDYALNGAYRTLTGTVVLNKEYSEYDSDHYAYEDRNHYDYVRVRIYADDHLVYESPIVAWGMEPNSFSVDVTGVQTLRVMINGMNFARLEWCEIE